MTANEISASCQESVSMMTKIPTIMTRSTTVQTRPSVITSLRVYTSPRNRDRIDPELVRSKNPKLSRWILRNSSIRMSNIMP